MIIFKTDIATDKILLAYTNNIVEFKIDNVLLPSKATISIGTSIKTLFPSPTGFFYLNFKEWIASIINVDNFNDDINLDIIDSGYVYDWTDKVYLNNIITFNVILSDGTIETATRDVKWLSAYLQIEDYKLKFSGAYNLDSFIVLSSTDNTTNQSCFLKYWDGYPFDIAFYNGTSSNVNIKNRTNLLEYDFPISTKVNRIAFDDGHTNITLQDVLPIMEGFNVLELTSNQSKYYINIEKVVDDCGGHYVKWLNDLGGWNYWLFPFGNRNRSTKDLGEINNDFNNISETTSPTIQIGKTSNDTIQITSDVIKHEESILLQSIIDSPKIYLFTGQPFAKANFNDWLEVSLNTTDVRVVNAKEKLNKFNFTIELPQRNTRKI